MNKPGWSDAGFSLIEVLIALVLLALGTLALFNLEFRALQNAQLAYSRSVASVVAMDAAESLWAAQVGLGEDGCLPQSGSGGKSANDVAGALQARWNAASPRHNYTVTIDVDDGSCSFSITVVINKSLGQDIDEEDKTLNFQLTLPTPDDLRDPLETGS